MVSAEDVILKYIFPALGMIAANIMFASPYKAIKSSIQKGDLGTLNPTPWAFMFGNCLGWVTYSILLQNLWIFFGNCPGLLMSVWYNLAAVKLSYHKYHVQEMRRSVVELLVNEGHTGSVLMRTVHLVEEVTTHNEVKGVSESASASTLDTGDLEKGNEEMKAIACTNSNENHEKNQASTPGEWAQLVLDDTSQKVPVFAPHENLIMTISIIWVIGIAIICLVPNISQKAREVAVASLVNANLVFFYGAPLSTIHTVTHQRDSSSIYVPTMITNTLNGFFWTAYGFAISDYFIAVPNALGALFGVVQVVLCILFPRKQQSKENRKGHETTDLVCFPLSAN